MTDWLPIESAPKNGTPILGWEGLMMTTVKWSEARGSDYGYLALVEAGHYAEDDEWQPTHWQPLPDPPK